MPTQNRGKLVMFSKWLIVLPIESTFISGKFQIKFEGGGCLGGFVRLIFIRGYPYLFRLAVLEKLFF